MKAVIRQFSAAGDTVLMEYDTETANMDEVNTFIRGLEKQTGGKAFDFKTSLPLDGPVNREHTDVLILHPICGG